MSQDVNPNNQEQAIDFFAWMKETVPFDDNDLDEELARQCELADSVVAGTDKSVGWLSEALKDVITRAKAKKAITEVALLFSGALELTEDGDYEPFAKKVLLQSENEDATANYIRNSLLTEDPSEPRQELALLLNDRYTEKRELLRAKAKFETRIDMFIDAFRKQRA